jgi:hypothetical protein
MTVPSGWCAIRIVTSPMPAAVPFRKSCITHAGCSQARAVSLDNSNLNSNTSRVSSRDAPWCPPIVEMSGGMVGHLLAWEMHERDGSWHAWVSWVQQAGGRHVHKVVDVRAGSLQPIEPPDAYSSVPRRVRGTDGLIRPWSGESGLGFWYELHADHEERAV